MDEIEEGTALLESIWFLMANTIVDLAIRTYELDPQQGSALREVFLKQNHYYVTIKS